MRLVLGRSFRYLAKIRAIGIAMKQNSAHRRHVDVVSSVLDEACIGKFLAGEKLVTISLRLCVTTYVGKREI